MSLQLVVSGNETCLGLDQEVEISVEEYTECAKENRVVNLQPVDVGKKSPEKMIRSNRSPEKRGGAEQALQAMKRMRGHENALSSKIIQNLQSDKAAFALKMEELQNFLSSAKQRCVALDTSVSALTSEKEQLESANQVLQQEVEELQETTAQQADTISQLEAALQQERAKQTAPPDVRDVELLKLAKRYLKRSLQLQRAKSEKVRPVTKNDWQSDSLVAHCNGCNKRFGTFLRRHHCRGCGKLFCGSCCQDNLSVLSDTKGQVPRQRSCKTCFKLADESETKKQQLHEQVQGELCALEDWLTRPEVNLEALLTDETA